MDVTQAPQSLASGPQTPTTAQDPTVISSDFETFLLMLTTQMQNQDPLNPIDSSDYAVQLATFSGVEQQVRTNDLLEGMAQQLNLSGLSQMAGWVGMEARAAVPANFDGTPLTLYPDPVRTAQEAVLLVRDASGNLIDRQPIPVSTESISWAGVDGNGTPWPPGLYSFEVESYARGELLNTRPVEVYARVSEVRNDGSQTMLVLEGGVEIASGLVKALREPGSSGG